MLSLHYALSPSWILLSMSLSLSLNEVNICEVKQCFHINDLFFFMLYLFFAYLLWNDAVNDWSSKSKQ